MASSDTSLIDLTTSLIDLTQQQRINLFIKIASIVNSLPDVTQVFASVKYLIEREDEFWSSAKQFFFAFLSEFESNLPTFILNRLTTASLLETNRRLWTSVFFQRYSTPQSAEKTFIDSFLYCLEQPDKVAQCFKYANTLSLELSSKTATCLTTPFDDCVRRQNVGREEEEEEDLYN